MRAVPRRSRVLWGSALRGRWSCRAREFLLAAAEFAAQSVWI